MGQMAVAVAPAPTHAHARARAHTHACVPGSNVGDVSTERLDDKCLGNRARSCQRAAPHPLVQLLGRKWRPLLCGNLGDYM